MAFFEGKQKTNTPGKPKSTQAFLDVVEVRDGVAVMKDGSLRAILAVSSVNFALKAEEEQNAIIGSYQNFLNSLDFPIQVVMQSRRMDIAPYLEMMSERMHGVSNKLLQMQMAEYIEFISRLVETGQIMSKTFLVVVPYYVHALKQGFLSRVGKIFNPGESVILDKQSFVEYKKALAQRVAHIQSQLVALGVQSIELDTTEIIELLYSSYNIGASANLQGETLNKLDIESETSLTPTRVRPKE